MKTLNYPVTQVTQIKEATGNRQQATGNRVFETGI